MKCSKRFAFLVLAIVVLSIACFLPGESESVEKNLGARLTPHAPIYISGDADFASQASNEGWAGNGTQINPYIIEGYEIDGNGGNYAIWIENTDVYFVIRNCYVHNAKGIGIAPYGSGIALKNVRNGTITNNNASGNTYGIYLRESSSTNITNNTMWGCGIGIWGYSIEHWNTHNIDTTNLVNGKPVYYYKNQNGGTVPSDGGQVILANCSNMVIEGLSISNASIAIQIGFSSNNRISNTIVSGNSDCGIYLLDSSNNNITNNNANSNGKAIYLWDSSNTITNNNISGNNYGIYLLGSSNNITNNNIRSNSCGIWLCGFSNTIRDNNISGNSEGICLIDSIQNIIANNSISGNGVGVLLTTFLDALSLCHEPSVETYGKWPLSYSRNNTIINNNVSGNSCGILLDWYSDNNIISNNQIIANSNEGILLWYVHNNIISANNLSSNTCAISLSYSHSNTITNNNASNNVFGLSLKFSNSNLITYNWFCNNLQYGVYITNDSTANTIHHNNFIANNGASRGSVDSISQAYDDCSGNYWYDAQAKEGNYWSNWDGKDWGTANAYVIDSYNPYPFARASDYYPLSQPAVAELSGTPMGLVILCLLSGFMLMWRKNFHELRNLR